jgi:hypothetical protein
MTLYSDYSATPGDNNSPPPVGAPEGMYPSSVNDTMREMMSVIRQLGDQVQTTFGGLGDMSKQTSSNVSISGGAVTATLAGPGSGVTSLNASNIASGTVPAGALSGSYPISVNSANDASTLGGVSLASLLPVGAIIMYMGNMANVDSNHWAVCDGTRGTPNLLNRYPCGTNSTGGMAPFGGGNQTTDSQGSHSHGGATLGHALTIEELPAHTHNTTITHWDRGGGNHGYIGPGTGNVGTQQWLSDPTGSDPANVHIHGIAADGAHTHTIAPPVPLSFGLWFLMRIA